MTSTTVLTDKPSTDEHGRPKLILPIGSGRTGKTFWSRWLIDRAADRGAPLEIIDGDTVARGVAAIYKDAKLAPEAIFPADQHAWFERAIEAAALSRRSAIIDFGPSLFGFADWLADAPLALAMEEAGVDLVAVYFLTPDPYSLPRLPYLIDLIKPPRTIIVLNEWGLDGNSPPTAFDAILKDPSVVVARADGARIVAMPDLPDAERLEAIRHRRPALADDPRPTDPVISGWLTRMDEAFAPVADWIV
jgi:hypothetical protein